MKHAQLYDNRNSRPFCVPAGRRRMAYVLRPLSPDDDELFMKVHEQKVRSLWACSGILDGRRCVSNRRDTKREILQKSFFKSFFFARALCLILRINFRFIDREKTPKCLDAPTPGSGRL